MKTRTLLLLAVASGLVILIAGSIKLFLLADADPPAHLDVGESGRIGDMTVRVVTAERSGSAVLVVVDIGGIDDADGAATWVFGTPSAQLRPSPTSSSSIPPCAATTAATSTCVLGFATTDGRGVLRYERAGETVRWDIDLDAASAS